MICTQQTWFDRPRPTYYSNTHVSHRDATDIVQRVLGKRFGAVAG
jgi:hypothetical protein